MAKAIEQLVWPLYSEGRIRPVIDSSFKLDDAAGAHRRIDDSEHIGKIVLVT
jgi:NADPH2:quinone reductase